MDNSSKKNLKETIKRFPLIKWVLRLFALGYSTCGVCKMPWKYTGHHSIMFDKYRGTGCVCEHCWYTKSKADCWSAVMKWWYEASLDGYTDYTILHVKECFEKEWEATHNEN